MLNSKVSLLALSFTVNLGSFLEASTAITWKKNKLISILVFYRTLVSTLERF
ncbi:MAG: hypothetical protein AB8B68_01285 [Rickettsiaceae bacterium]